MESLDAVEIRVLGCLLEKQQTTPDAYPLTLNSLRLACNQSTNRDPVVDYDEATVREAAQRLGKRGWARMASYHGSRSAKYRHLLDDALGLAPDERALLCVLMLRGPQTLGELKQRSERLHAFADLARSRTRSSGSPHASSGGGSSAGPGRRRLGTGTCCRTTRSDGGERAAAAVERGVEPTAARAGRPCRRGCAAARRGAMRCATEVAALRDRLSRRPDCVPSGPGWIRTIDRRIMSPLL